MSNKPLANASPKDTSNKGSDRLMLQQGLALALEKIMNKALSLNINDNSALASLESKQLSIELDELAFPLNFQVCDQQILVNSLTENSDCIITTSLNTLKALQQHQQLTELIKQDKLDIVGDLKVAQQFANFAQHLKIDWQHELAKCIGGFATYKLGRFAKELTNTFNFFKQQVQADSSEWLVHEKKLVITKNQLDTFNTQIKQVTYHADNLAHRLAILEQKISS